MADLPQLRPDMTFDEVCHAALEFLAAAVPMGYWSVSRQIAGKQLYLDVIDRAYGTAPGDSHPWSASFCQHMVTGSAPQIAPQAMKVPAYASAGVAQTLTIGAYIGLPITTEDGKLFGTLCGLDPEAQSNELYSKAPLLRQVRDLLARFLDDDLHRTAESRDRERADKQRAADAHRMVNEDFWLSTLTREEPRLKRFGECAAVVAVAVDADRKAVAAEVLAKTTRSADVVAGIEVNGFGILAHGIKPDDAPSLIARLEAALATAEVAASLAYREVTIKTGLANAWREALSLTA